MMNLLLTCCKCSETITNKNTEIANMALFPPLCDKCREDVKPLLIEVKNDSLYESGIIDLDGFIAMIYNY